MHYILVEMSKSWFDMMAQGILTAGIVRRFVLNVLNPRDRNVRVIYVFGGDCGTKAQRPMAYKGHRS